MQHDLAGYGLKTSPPEMRRFLGMLAHVHGGLLNASELGRSLEEGMSTSPGHYCFIVRPVPAPGDPQLRLQRGIRAEGESPEDAD